MPQLQIIADRARIAQYGLNVSDVADLIELAIGGASISQIFVGSKSYDVICRFDDASRNSPERIGNLLLTTGSGTKIPLSQVAEIKMTTGASTITREMNKRHLTVRVNLRGVDLTAFLNKANALIDKEVKYDHDSVHLKWAGQFENQHRAYARLGAVVPLALGLMLLGFVWWYVGVECAGNDIECFLGGWFYCLGRCRYPKWRDHDFPYQ